MTMRYLKPAFCGFDRILRRFKRDDRGNIALVFGLSSVMIFTAMGAGLDLSRAYLARQKLSQVATLACQYASRPAILDTSTASYTGSNGGTAYITHVNSFINTAWQGQSVNLTQTNGTPFSYTQGGAANVSLSASVPTTFMQIAGFTAIPIAAQSHCYDTPASVVQRVADSNSQMLVQESFEAGGQPGQWIFYKPNGSIGTQATPTGYTSAVGYTGVQGTQWHITGYCLEQDAAGIIASTKFDGNYAVELDCDNGSGTKGNSAISTLVYAPAGTYELRYAYASRVSYPSYDPTYLCGSAVSDLSWANSTTTSWTGAMATASRTNQINVYFDLNTNNAPPTHTTLDGTQTLSGSNLIDMCLYGDDWVERSVMITVTTPGYYWLSFAADGTSDTYGGQLDAIRLCKVSCSGSVQDNFPAAWISSSMLFEDTFESPTYSPDFSNWINKSGNLNSSKGISGTSSSGWPNQSASGWATAPFNQINYILQGAAQGSQYIAMDGYNSSGNSLTNRLISRPFLLDPGYYQVSYKYISDVDFSSTGVSGTSCYAAPASSSILPSSYSSLTGNIRFYTSISSNASTNIVGVFMPNGQLVSTPITGGALASTTSYNNPDGTISTTPTVPPDTVTWSSYNASALNPVVDVCGYAASYAWQSRSASVKITKTGYYWLTFSANGGKADGNGGGVDDVKLTALGSLYMNSPPASAVTIPAPSPQPGSSIFYTGFSVTANPLTP
jgi:Flp pilus assembly protein TadG